MGINTTGASLLIAIVSWYTGGGSVSVSDSLGNAWTLGSSYASSSDAGLATYYCSSPTVGSGHTFTVASADSPSICVAAFSGTRAGGTPDMQVGSTTSYQTGSGTPGANGDLVITGIQSTDTSVPTAPTSFTLLDAFAYVSGADYAMGMAYYVQATAAALNPSWGAANTSPVSLMLSFPKATAAINTGQFFPFFSG
ncbi:MAG: hypothetical protein JO130_18460 [Solirubrobacterales bacterium]|nr:hypothetical protein [Solirubrobacterales bacterium]